MPDSPELTALLPARTKASFDLKGLTVSRQIERDDYLFNPLGQIALGLRLRGMPFDLCHFPYIIHPLGTRIPRVVTVHDLIPLWLPHELPNKGRQWLYRFALRISISGARALLMPTRHVADAVRGGLGFKGTVAVTPYGVDPIFRPQGDPGAVLSQYSLQPGYLLCVSSHRPHKNLLFLLEVHQQVVQAAPCPPTLVVIGSRGPSTPQLLRAVKTLGLRDRVRFLEWVPEGHLPAFYSGAKLFLFPSLMEGFGFPPLEARACGSPALVSDIPAMRENHGPGSLLLPPADRDAWVQAIVHLLQDPAKREEMAAGAAEGLKTLTWERTARLTLQAYREALA